MVTRKNNFVMSSTTEFTIDGEEDNPFVFTIEIIVLLAVACGLLFILIICCCCIVKKRREKTIEVTPSAIKDGKVTPSQLLDAGMSPQSVVDVGAATPSQLVEEGLARPHEVDLQKKNNPAVLYQAPTYGHPPPPPRLAAPEELLQAGYTPSQLSTYDVIHRKKEEEKKERKVAVVGSDETLKKETSKIKKRVVIEPSQGTIYNGPIKRTVNNDEKTVVEGKNGKNKDDVNNTFSTWMSPKKKPNPSTVPSNYTQVDKGKKAGRVMVVESGVSRKGSTATDVYDNKESKVSNVSKVKTQSPSMKTQGKRSNTKTVSKANSSHKAKSLSPRTKKGKSKYDVDD